jgi:hypothetical protein
LSSRIGKPISSASARTALSRGHQARPHLSYFFWHVSIEQIGVTRKRKRGALLWAA